MSRKLENLERIIMFIDKGYEEQESINVIIGVVEDLKEGYKLSRHRPLYIYMTNKDCNFMSRLDDNYKLKRGSITCLEMVISTVNSNKLNETKAGGVMFNEITGTLEYLDVSVLNMIDDFNNIKDHSCLILKEFINRQVNMSLLKRIKDLEGVINND